MHELSIVEKIVQTTEQFAEEKDIANVRKVMLRIGKMTGVLPKYVRSYYKDLIVGTRLEGSELDIEVIPGQCFCRNCGCTFDAGEETDRCPECGDSDYEVIQGNELMIKEIAYED